MGILDLFFGRRNRTPMRDSTTDASKSTLCDNSPRSSTDRFASLMKLQDFSGALAVVDMMLADAPAVALSWRARGEVLYEMCRFGEAIESFERAHELSGPGTERVLIWKAFCLYKSGRRVDAENELTRLIDSSPHSEVRGEAALVRAQFHSK